MLNSKPLQGIMIQNTRNQRFSFKGQTWMKIKVPFINLPKQFNLTIAFKREIPRKHSKKNDS